MDRWCNKVAVVTGASSGIGAAITRKLVEAGVIVIGLARRVELVEEMREELSSCKGKLYAKKVDLTVQEEIVEVFKWISANIGPVQILINNAGVVTPTTLLNGDYGTWKSIVDTNLMAVAICTKEAVKMMKDNDLAGHVVIINSVCGNKFMPTTHMYGPSKTACANFSEQLRFEICSEKLKVKLTSIYPGAVNTPMLLVNEKVRALLEPMPKLQASEIADTVMYVLGTPQNLQITHMTMQSLGEHF